MLNSFIQPEFHHFAGILKPLAEVSQYGAENSLLPAWDDSMDPAGTVLAGKVIAIIGSIAVIKQADRYSIVNTKSLNGFMVCLSTC